MYYLVVCAWVLHGGDNIQIPKGFRLPCPEPARVRLKPLRVRVARLCRQPPAPAADRSWLQWDGPPPPTHPPTPTCHPPKHTPSHYHHPARHRAQVPPVDARTSRSSLRMEMMRSAISFTSPYLRWGGGRVCEVWGG